MYLLISLAINTSALLATGYLVPGIKFEGIQPAILAAIILGVLNTFIKPILKIITLPLTILTLGLFSFVLNALILLLVSSIIPGFSIDGLWPAILGAIVLSVISTILSAVLKDLSK